MEIEIWKDIPSLEGRYQASSFGRIKSVERVVIFSDGRKYEYHENILKLRCDKDGYILFTVRDNGKHRTLKVHRAVLLSFYGNPLNIREVNHKNGTKSDNRISNLEWVTSSENKLHAISIGISNPTKNLKPHKGLNHHMTKTLIVYKNNVEVKRYTPISEASKDGYSLGTMFKQMRKCREYKGFTFKKITNEKSQGITTSN